MNSIFNHSFGLGQNKIINKLTVSWSSSQLCVDLRKNTNKCPALQHICILAKCNVTNKNKAFVLGCLPEIQTSHPELFRKHFQMSSVEYL